MRGELEKEIRKLTKSLNIPFKAVPVEKLNKLAKGANHQGLVAMTAAIVYQSIEELIPFLYEQATSPKLLILDGIEDVRNLAAISRSAVWFGFDAIVLGIKSSAPVNSIAIKISAGALLNIPVCREKSLVNTVDFLIESGFTIYGTDMHGDSPLFETQFQAPLAIVMGSEFKGMNKAIEKKCHHIISIPGTGNVESLNVSVAAALVMGQVFTA